MYRLMYLKLFQKFLFNVLLTFSEIYSILQLSQGKGIKNKIKKRRLKNYDW